MDGIALDDAVLVLNRSWIAVNVASVRRAISLLYQGLAQVVSADDFTTYDFDSWRALSQACRDGRFVHTVNYRLRVPEVILLKFFNGFYRREVRFSRRNIFERDQNTCQYCGRVFPRQELTIDHVVPRSRGGRDCWENVVLACVRCNVRKGQRLPREAGMRLIRPPRKPNWVPHISFQCHTGMKPSWQRFVDIAYWDLELDQD